MRERTRLRTLRVCDEEGVRERERESYDDDKLIVQQRIVAIAALLACTCIWSVEVQVLAVV